MDNDRQSINSAISDMVFNSVYSGTRNGLKACKGCYCSKTGALAAEKYLCSRLPEYSSNAVIKLRSKIKSGINISPYLEDSLFTELVHDNRQDIEELFRWQGKKLATWAALNLFKGMFEIPPEAFIRVKQRVSLFDKIIVITPCIPYFVVKESYRGINTAYKKGRQLLYAETDEKEKDI